MIETYLFYNVDLSSCKCNVVQGRELPGRACNRPVVWLLFSSCVRAVALNLSATTRNNFGRRIYASKQRILLFSSFFFFFLFFSFSYLQDGHAFLRPICRLRHDRSLPGLREIRHETFDRKRAQPPPPPLIVQCIMYIYRREEKKRHLIGDGVFDL